MDHKELDELIKKHNKKLKKIRDHANSLADCVRNLESLKPEPQYKRNKDGTLVKEKVDRWKNPNRPFSTKEMTDAEHTKCVEDCCKEADAIKFT